MRLVFALVLLLGLGLAGFAVYMAQNYMAQIQAERDMLAAAQAQAPELVDVVVAKRPMKYGERLTREDLQTIKWPKDSLPSGVFHMVAAPADAPADAPAVFAANEARPRAALRSFEPFEPILASKVTAPGVDAGITSNLTPGKRALAIKVDVTTGVSGFLRPGDRVDVYWSGNAQGKEVTKLIQPGVRLIAIDQNADADRSEETLIARTVTVEATAQEVAALAQAQSTGRLTDWITTEHYHDMGKLLFSFVIFWGYIAFSQYMLIWYANIPEETMWYLTRQTGTWLPVSLILLFGGLLIPFFGLLPRWVKRNKMLLAFWAVWLLVVHYVDVFWLVMPSHTPEAAYFGPVDAGCLVGLGGLYLAGLLRVAGNRPLVPSKDPRLGEALAFENI